LSAPDWWCPLPLDCATTYGALVIADVTLHGPAWCAHNLSSLYNSPAFRDANVLVESEEGTVARPIVDDETDYSLPMMFSGATNQAGAPWVNAAGGLLDNRQEFTDTFCAPIRSGIATLPATLTVPSGLGGVTIYTFPCQPLALSNFALLPGAYARAVFELRLTQSDLLVGGGGEGGEGEGE